MSTKKQQQRGQATAEEMKERLVFVFEALGDPTRLKLFRFLIKNRGLCVSELAEKFGISVPAASYQMKILEVVGLVKKERMGKMICYALKKEDYVVKQFIKVVQ